MTTLMNPIVYVVATTTAKAYCQRIRFWMDGHSLNSYTIEKQ